MKQKSDLNKVAFLFALKCLYKTKLFQSQEIGSEIMNGTPISKLNTEDIEELAKFFDLLAKYDFEDAQASNQSQEVNTGFSYRCEKSLLVSCDDETNNNYQETFF